MTAPAASTALQRFAMVIGGEAIGASGPAYESHDPYHGRPWARIPRATTAQLDLAVGAARDAFEGEWAATTPGDRGRLMLRLADLIDEQRDELARIEATDNGKLLRETVNQVTGIARWYRYYAGLADKVDGRVPVMDPPEAFTYIRREPVGVVAAIPASNSPLVLTTMKVAPALATGNTVVVKPSPTASASVLHLGSLFARAGFPAGVVNVVTGDDDELGAELVSHAGVDLVAFTGGPSTARRIAHSTADRLTPTTFELGGKSANIVFPDADLDAALAGALSGIFSAAGQTCVAGSRLLLHESIHDAFVERLVPAAEAIVLGDPMDPTTEMGPMHSPGALAHVERCVAEAHEDGARLVTGGRRRADLGGDLFYEPTIFAGVAAASRLAQEEVFGPVLAVLSFTDDDDAVRIANGTPFGLAAGLWTSDVKRVHRVAARLRAGSVWVNTYRHLSPLVPFGGSGQSGHARENGTEVLAEYTRPKTVWIDLAETAPTPFVGTFAAGSR